MVKSKSKTKAFLSVKMLKISSPTYTYCLRGSRFGWMILLSHHHSSLSKQATGKAITQKMEKGMATHSSIPAWRIPWFRGAWQAPVHGVKKSRTRLSG